MTILPTGMAWGATEQLPLEERVLRQRSYLDDALAVRLGGRAAEEIVFGLPSTGAQDDLTSATELAAKMVREWGMSDELGQMSWGPSGPVFLGEDLIHTRDYSDETARVIDREVSRILGEQASRSKKTLQENSRPLDAVANALIEKESLDGKEIRQIIESSKPSPKITPIESARHRA